jgi:phosphatidylserine synthase
MKDFRGIVASVTVAILCFSALLISIHYGWGRLYPFWSTAICCSIGYTIGGMIRYKKKRVIDKKAFLPLLIISIGCVGGTLILYFNVMHFVPFIVILNLICAGIATIYIFKYTRKISNI